MKYFRLQEQDIVVIWEARQVINLQLQAVIILEHELNWIGKYTSRISAQGHLIMERNQRFHGNVGDHLSFHTRLSFE